MEYLDKYTKHVAKTELMSPELANTLAMLKMVKRKIEIMHGIKGYKALSKLLNYSPEHLSAIFNGRSPITENFVYKLCFAAGLDNKDFERAYKKRAVDEYMTKNHHLMVDGVDYGPVIPKSK